MRCIIPDYTKPVLSPTVCIGIQRTRIDQQLVDIFTQNDTDARTATGRIRRESGSSSGRCTRIFKAIMTKMHCSPFFPFLFFLPNVFPASSWPIICVPVD